MTDLWDTWVVKKIDKCGIELAWWSKKSFGSVKRELQQKKESFIEGRERLATYRGLKKDEISGG